MNDRVVNERWRMEVSNPRSNTDWQPIWEFDDDQLTAYEKLIEELV